MYYRYINSIRFNYEQYFIPKQLVRLPRSSAHSQVCRKETRSPDGNTSISRASCMRRQDYHKWHFVNNTQSRITINKPAKPVYTPNVTICQVIQGMYDSVEDGHHNLWLDRSGICICPSIFSPEATIKWYTQNKLQTPWTPTESTLDCTVSMLFSVMMLNIRQLLRLRLLCMWTYLHKYYKKVLLIVFIVCVLVCVFVYVHAFVCMCVFVRTWVCASVHAYVNVYVYLHVTMRGDPNFPFPCLNEIFHTHLYNIFPLALGDKLQTPFSRYTRS